MSRYVLTIERWHPATINELLRRVKTRIRLKKVDRNIRLSVIASKTVYPLPPARAR